MCARPSKRKVKSVEPPGSLAANTMNRLNRLAAVLSIAAASLGVALPASADLSQLNDGAPLLLIKSNGGLLSVRPGEPDGIVRIPGNPQGVRMDRFNVNVHSSGSWILPPLHCAGSMRHASTHGHGSRAGLAEPSGRPCGGPVRIPLPSSFREGPHGVAITNPGGDLSVGVPTRFEAMVVNAGASPVVVERTRGPFIISGDNDVTLRGVTGRGWVRSTRGAVDVRGQAGSMRIDTDSGPITLQTGAAFGAAQVSSTSGDITWTLNSAGAGPYRVSAGSGTVRILVRPGVSANIDAVSENGFVINNLPSAAATVLLSRPHAVSLTVGGGGAQMTVQSVDGIVLIAPAP